MCVISQPQHVFVSAFATLWIVRRMAPFDGSAWEEEDDETAPPAEVPYYNNFPGKQPPPGGVIDMRTRPGATLVRELDKRRKRDLLIDMIQQIQRLTVLYLRDDIFVKNVF